MDISINGFGPCANQWHHVDLQINSIYTENDLPAIIIPEKLDFKSLAAEMARRDGEIQKCIDTQSAENRALQKDLQKLESAANKRRKAISRLEKEVQEAQAAQEDKMEEYITLAAEIEVATELLDAQYTQMRSDAHACELHERNAEKEALELRRQEPDRRKLQSLYEATAQEVEEIHAETEQIKLDMEKLIQMAEQMEGKRVQIQGEIDAIRAEKARKEAGLQDLVRSAKELLDGLFQEFYLVDGELKQLDWELERLQREADLRGSDDDSDSD